MQNLIYCSGTMILNSAFQPPVFFPSERRSPAVDGHSEHTEVAPRTWAVIAQRHTLPRGCCHAEPDCFSISNLLKSCMGIQRISERHSLLTCKLSRNEDQRTVAVKGVGFMPQYPG